jgi:cation:H+ antiporter
MNDGLQLLGGLILLYFGAEWFVGGGAALALALRVPQLLVGLTIVAYGTSAPELVVGIEAALSGHGQVALGNVVGSNIANIGLILGIAVLIRPARVDGALRQREVPMLLASGAVVPLVLRDAAISRLEGVALLLVALGYTGWMVHRARSPQDRSAARAEAEVAEEAADAAGAPSPGGVLRALLTAVGGLLVLLLGGQLFVSAAVAVAQTLGMSERLVGLTIVAVGTSLPELVTSAIAARRGHSDLAVGNVVGSNIFNSFLCLGAAAAVRPLAGPLELLPVDLGMLLLLTVLAAVLLRSARTIPRVEGLLVLLLYGGFLIATITGG